MGYAIVSPQYLFTCKSEVKYFVHNKQVVIEEIGLDHHWVVAVFAQQLCYNVLSGAQSSCCLWEVK